MPSVHILDLAIVLGMLLGELILILALPLLGLARLILILWCRILVPQVVPTIPLVVLRALVLSGTLTI